MTQVRTISPKVTVIGENPTQLWGMSSTERTKRITAKQGLDWQEARSASGPGILVNAGFAFDPGWLAHIAAHPGYMLTMGNVPVLAHTITAEQTDAIVQAMRNNQPVSLSDMTSVAFETGPTLENKELRKREVPFLDRLNTDTVRTLERASYFGAYKGVTDVLTKYLWPEWALVLTRIAARFGITPNMVTMVGAILCVFATFAFAYGHYWAGMAMGLVFMVFDTVDGKLARCTITSSHWGHILDHGMDLVHPPFWWYFWGIGLASWGLALSPECFWMVMGAMFAGYVLQRLIEGAFIAQFGMHIHVWQRFDSMFRLYTARRNPNMVILFVSALFGRPDLGIIAVAWWTVISLIVHGVRLVQAYIQKARGDKLVSWLAG